MQSKVLIQNPLQETTRTEDEESSGLAGSCYANFLNTVIALRSSQGNHGGLAQPFGPECATKTSVSNAEDFNLSGRRPETDRRKWDRLPLAIPIFVRSKVGNDKELLEFATALNVSAGGALVAVRRALPLSSQVLLEIPSAPLVSGSDLPKASRNLQARIVWVKHAEGYQLAGVKFSHALLSSPSALPAKRRKAVSQV